MRSALYWILSLAILALAVGSATNAQAAPKKLYDRNFEKMDINRDKKVSLDEYMGTKKGEEREKAARIFKKLDKDGDKALSLKEFKL